MMMLATAARSLRGGTDGAQWHFAMQQRKREQHKDSPCGQMLEEIETIGVSIRTKSRYPFHVIDSVFRHGKVYYCGRIENHAQLSGLFGLENLFVTNKRAEAPPTRRASR